jgi:hypothetical protein
MQILKGKEIQMNTQTESKVYVAQLELTVMDTRLSDRAILAGSRRHYIFKVVNYGPVPLAPYTREDGYWIEPVSIPPRGLDRIMCLVRADIPILGYVVVHEPKPQEKKEEVRDFKISKPIVPARENSGEEVLKTVGAVAGAAAVGLGFLFLLALRIDPMLIVVLDDPQKTWLQIEAWYE